jgi:leucyl/phenylalanyl-tRNA--protein transferase
MTIFSLRFAALQRHSSPWTLHSPGQKSYRSFDISVTCANLLQEKFNFVRKKLNFEVKPFTLPTIMSLDINQLLYAYTSGIFPMAQDGDIYWYDPDPRAILPLDNFHIPRSLQRTIKQGHFDIRIDHDFNAVIRACSDRPSTWISDEFIAAYNRLHQLGFAHTVETWHDGELVGGLYGVAIHGLFAGESMFSRERDASKVALVHLVRRMRARGLTLLDVQFQTDHLRRFGTIEIPREQYHLQLANALQQKATFGGE